MWTYTPGGKDLVYGPLLGTYVDFAADPGTGGWGGREGLF